MFNENVNVHIELTDKCNALCSMCGRQYIENGELKKVPTFDKNELSITEIRNIFDNRFFEKFNLNRINFCGNISDPITSMDLCSTIEYLKPHCKRIDIATNGSLRTPKYFKNLANILKDIDHRVTFALDGLEDTHSYYRINTNFNKVIQNAKAFIDAGGNARWQFIIFKHNKHQIDTAKKMSKELGFNEFVSIRTQRFARADEWTFIHKNKKYKLEEPDKSLSFEVSGDVKCKAKKDNEFYLDYQGNVHMCCYLGGSYLKKRFDQNEDAILEWYDDKENNAIENDLSDILLKSEFFQHLQNSWSVLPSTSCKRFCSKKNLRKKLYD